MWARLEQRRLRVMCVVPDARRRPRGGMLRHVRLVDIVRRLDGVHAGVRVAGFKSGGVRRDMGIGTAVLLLWRGGGLEAGDVRAVGCV